MWMSVPRMVVVVIRTSVSREPTSGTGFSSSTMRPGKRAARWEAGRSGIASDIRSVSMLVPSLLLAQTVPRRTIVHLDDSHFFFHNALFDDHLFWLFLGGAGPNCRARSPAECATDNRAAGTAYLGAYAWCSNPSGMP